MPEGIIEVTVSQGEVLGEIQINTGSSVSDAENIITLLRTVKT